MGATAHLYLPVYDKIQITTSYEYLEIRQWLNPVPEPKVLLRELKLCLLLFKIDLLGIFSGNSFPVSRPYTLSAIFLGWLT
jgi:hypothetical protein